MTQAVAKPQVSFEEYIDFCVQTDERYELVRGELIKRIPPTWAYVLIARFLGRATSVQGLVEGKYEVKRFQSDEAIESFTFGRMKLTAEQVFAAGKQKEK